MRISLLCLDRGVPFGGTRKGASVHLQSFASALIRQGHEVSAICAETGESDAARDLVARGLELRPLRQPCTVREIDWHLSQTRPDLVVERLSLGGPQGAIAAREAGVPHLYEVNAPLDEEAAMHRGLADSGKARAQLAEGFAASSGAVAVSDEVAGWVRRLSPEGYPVAVEPNGAGPVFFDPPATRALQHAMLQMRSRSGEYRVGFVGAFRPWHDLPTLIAAVARVAKLLPTRLVLVGDGPTRNDVLRLACELGAPITLVGRVSHDQVPAHMALMDVVAVPYASVDAYFSPLKLFESMAAARAIVASATRPVTRVVEHDRQALLVPPGDAGAMAAALAELARDPARRARLGAEARRAAESRHTWDAVAARVIAFAMRTMRREPESCES